MKLLIKNGTLINPAKLQHEVGDILIEDTKIIEIANRIKETPDMKIYDAAGQYVCPGFIDMHTHMREPGQEGKEGLVTGTQAAAAGGFTTIVTMANTTPVVDNAFLLKGLMQRASEDAIVKVKFFGAISKGLKGEELAEIGLMAAAGAVGFSDDGHYVENANLMRRALEYGSMFGKIIVDHAEDMTMAACGHMHEGNVSYELGIPARPSMAESIAVARDILIAEAVKAPIHIAHISTKEGVELVRAAKKRGLTQVTCEVTSQHLTFTDEDLKTHGSAMKMAPPIRSEDHRQALLEGLHDGTIDAIITDHAPHTPLEKDQEFCCTPNGFTGLETSIGAVITRAVKTGYLTIDRMVEVMSVNPAKLLGIEGGVLEVGKAADITVIDSNQVWTVDRNKFYTKGKTNPFHGMELTGKAVLTVVDGKIVMKNGIVV